MIGLKRDTVQVITYQADWHDLFEQERCALHKHIGHLVLDIQHVGSTAVPGLDAKPILDIAVAVIPQCQPLLCALGYLDRGDGNEGGYLFVKESAPDVRTHHLHMLAKDDPRWGNYLRFRDVLKADETLRTTYANLKKALQEQFSQDRQAYTAAKHTFIRDILQQNNGSQGHEADCLQRPLVSRSRFQQQLSASVKPQLGFSKTLFLATDSTIVWSLRLWGLY